MFTRGGGGGARGAARRAGAAEGAAFALGVAASRNLRGDVPPSHKHTHAHTPAGGPRVGSVGGEQARGTGRRLFFSSVAVSVFFFPLHLLTPRAPFCFSRPCRTRSQHHPTHAHTHARARACRCTPTVMENSTTPPPMTKLAALVALAVVASAAAQQVRRGCTVCAPAWACVRRARRTDGV